MFFTDKTASEVSSDTLESIQQLLSNVETYILKTNADARIDEGKQKLSDAAKNFSEAINEYLRYSKAKIQRP